MQPALPLLCVLPVQPTVPLQPAVPLPYGTEPIPYGLLHAQQLQALCPAQLLVCCKELQAHGGGLRKVDLPPLPPRERLPQQSAQ